MPAIDEISPDVFRISIYNPDFDMQFNHFLVRDDAPLLFHTGYRGMFPALRDDVAKLIDIAKLRYGDAWIELSRGLRRGVMRPLTFGARRL